MPVRPVRGAGVLPPAVSRVGEGVIVRPVGRGEELAFQLRSALAAAQSSLNNSLQVGNTESQNTAAVLKRDDLKKVAEKNLEFQKNLQSVEVQAKARIADLTKTVDARSQGLTQLQNDLEELLAQLFVLRRQI